MMGCCSELKGLFYIVILLSSEYGTQNAAGFLPRYVMSEIVIRYLPKCVPFPLNVRVLAHMYHNFIGFFFLFTQRQNHLTAEHEQKFLLSNRDNLCKLDM